MRASRTWDDSRVMPPLQIETIYGVDIKPCPFCGCRHIGLYMGPSPHMTCANCGADGPAFDGRAETLAERQAQAVKAWNGSMPRQPVLKPEHI